MAKLKLEMYGQSMRAEGTEQFVSGERSAFLQAIDLTFALGCDNEATVCASPKKEASPDTATSPDDAAEPERAAGTEEPDELWDCMVILNNITHPGSWADIASAIRQGYPPLKEGDCVSFRMKDGQDVDMIITQVTDEFVRFESRDCVGELVRWNEENDTDGGIEKSNVQTYLMDELFYRLPDALQAAISVTKRKYLDNEGNAKEYDALLFLPAASEVFDEGDCYGDKGLYEQLDYYKDRRHRMKGRATGEDTCDWWLASVPSGNSTNACIVGYHGYAGHTYASDAYRVPLCFIIKKS